MPVIFDARRLPQVGVHDATLEEVEATFALSGRRRVLFDNLKQYVASVKLTEWACQVLVDGSFIMPSVAEPNDIDIILVLPADWDAARTDFKAYEYHVLDRKHTKRVWKIEVYPVVSGSAEERKFLELFAQVREEWCDQFGWPKDTLKGIVRVTP